MSKARAHLVSRIAAPALVVAAASLTVTHGVAQAAPGCPPSLSTLPAGAIDQAMVAAVEQAAQAFPDRDTSGAYAVGATMSESGPVAQKIIKDCGVEAQRRTVVVDLVLPAMLPDSARTFGSVRVSYLRDGYRVWQAHW